MGFFLYRTKNKPKGETHAVLQVPSHASFIERQNIINSSKIANINYMLINTHAANALAYAQSKKETLVKGNLPINILMIDMGLTSFSISYCKMRNQQV